MNLTPSPLHAVAPMYQNRRLVARAPFPLVYRSNIPAFQAGAPGSTPGRDIYFVLRWERGRENVGATNTHSSQGETTHPSMDLVKALVAGQGCAPDGAAVAMNPLSRVVNHMVDTLPMGAFLPGPAGENGEELARARVLPSTATRWPRL